MAAVRRAADMALLGLPGALTVYLAFNAGGYFAGTQGIVAVGLALVLVLRVLLAEDPFAGAGRLLAVAAGALALLAGWSLLSSTWSDAPGRALLEFDRALLYLLALLLFGSIGFTPDRVRWMVRWLALGMLSVCAVGLVTRVLPEVWPIAPNIEPSRLAYPITYWNTLGLLGALAAVFSLHLSASEREPRVVRALAAAALPVLAATVYFTLSRGAIAAGALGLAAYAVLARPRGLAGALVAALPASVVAVVFAWRADELIGLRPTSEAAVSQGHDVAIAVALCALVAGLARLGLTVLDARLDRRGRPWLSWRAVLGLAALVAVVGGGVAVALDGPDYVSRQYETFVERRQPETAGDDRARLTDPSSNGRVDLWRVAIDAFEASPWKGAGAGTFQTLWNRERPFYEINYDGHSLYAEVLGELGLVGLALVLLAVLVLLGGAAWRIRGPDRALGAVAFAALLTWGLRAGVDWDWEMPVVTLWAFALGGLLLAARAAPSEAAAAPGHVGPPRVARVAIAVACLVVAVTPWRVAQSQSHLNDAVRAFDRGDCPAAIDAALDSLGAVGGRPQPHQILAYCDVRLGRDRLALRQARRAAELDPDHWEYRYVVGVLRGLLGEDPRPDLRAAERLNPFDNMPDEALERFERAPRRTWPARARRTPLPGI